MGPLDHFCDEEMRIELLQAFIGSVRLEQSNQEDEDYLFVFDRGTESNNVDKLIYSFKKSTGVQVGKPIDSTYIRRMWVPHMKFMGIKVPPCTIRERGFSCTNEAFATHGRSEV